MPEVNDKYGAYKIVRLLGKGEYGEVWLADWITEYSTRPVALKFAKKFTANLETLQKEANLLSNLGFHTNLINLFEVNKYNNQVIFVSEFATNGTVTDLIKKSDNRCPNLKDVYKIVKDILNGLNYLHGNKIIHCDLKPDNILFKGDTAAIGDFGTARFLDDTTSSVVGTPFYRAPEAFDGSFLPQSDIWSVGIILFQLLVGNVPFYHFDKREFEEMIKEDITPSMPNTIALPLQNIVKKALEKSPHHRYKSADEMLGALERAWTVIEEADLIGGLHNYNSISFEDIDSYLAESSNNGGFSVGLRDPEIQGAIYEQFRLLAVGSLMTDEEISCLNDTLTVLENKLCAVKYHVRKFEIIEEKKLREINDNQDLLDCIKSGVFLSEPGLKFEFESFYLQLKCVLNCLMKLLYPTLQLPLNKLSEFNSNKLIEILNGIQSQNAVLAQRIKDFMTFVKNESRWINTNLDLCNVIATKNRFLVVSFVWNQEKSIITPPTNDAGEPLLKSLKDIFANLLLFSRDFLEYTIIYTLPKEAKLRNLTEREKRDLSDELDVDLKNIDLVLDTNLVEKYTDDGIEKTRKYITTTYNDQIENRKKYRFSKIKNIMRARIFLGYTNSEVEELPEEMNCDFCVHNLLNKNKTGVNILYLLDPYSVIDRLKNIIEEIRSQMGKCNFIDYQLYIVSEDFMGLDLLGKKYSSQSVNRTNIDIYFVHMEEGKILMQFVI